MSIVCYADDSHDISNLVFPEKLEIIILDILIYRLLQFWLTVWGLKVFAPMDQES